MNRSLARLLLFLLVTSSASGCLGGGESIDVVDETKAEMDQLAHEFLPELAAAGDGEYPKVTGSFMNCLLGHTRMKYDITGEVHGSRSPDSTVKAMANAAREHGFRIVTGPEELSFVAERDDVTLVVDAYPKPIAGKTVTGVDVETDCVDYTSDGADHAASLPTEVYGAPLRPQG